MDRGGALRVKILVAGCACAAAGEVARRCRAGGRRASSASGTPAARSRTRSCRRPRAPEAATARIERFTDEHGHTLTLATDLPDLNLRPFARDPGRAPPSREIEDAVVEVVAPASTRRDLRRPGRGRLLRAGGLLALSSRGRIWIPSSDADLLHVIAHEYGHHVDNQLVNLGHLDLGLRPRQRRQPQLVLPARCRRADFRSGNLVRPGGAVEPCARRDLRGGLHVARPGTAPGGTTCR